MDYGVFVHLCFEQETGIRPATAGRTEFSWDGRNDDGNLVPPGLYILDITVSGDTGDRSSHQVVSVAY